MEPMQDALVPWMMDGLADTMRRRGLFSGRCTVARTMEAREAASRDSAAGSPTTTRLPRERWREIQERDVWTWASPALPATLLCNPDARLAPLQLQREFQEDGRSLGP